MLSIIEGQGEKHGEREDTEEEEEVEEDASLVSCEEVDDEDEECLMSSGGDGERGVGGSEEVMEEREGMLEVELWDGFGSTEDRLDADGRLLFGVSGIL